MFNCEDFISLSDDENSPQIETMPSSTIDANNKIEIIVIDEEQPQQATKSAPKSFSVINSFSKIYDENKLFAEFLLKCLELENSDGMLRILNKTLVKTYEQIDVKYRHSLEINRVLVKALDRLNRDPNHKFSHVKDLVETFKLHIVKKRVQLTTLATNLKKNGIDKRKFARKGRVEIIIDSDDEQIDIPTINLDDDQNDISTIVLDNVIDEEKENHETEPNSQTENLLEPRVVDNCEPKAEANKEEIRSLEKAIAMYKMKIEQYEQAEVVDDSPLSPYVLCESYKRDVVMLYKKLCDLVGETPVKKRQVRLEVLEGHPPGPTRRLEKFINDNIGEDGVPHFPDFCDVVKCVMVANIKDKLRWNQRLVMFEANALFTQCGRALQKRRQRREYRDLLASVKAEPMHDPADDDPELLARLEQNWRYARRKEDMLLERYTMLQNLPPQAQKPGPSVEDHNIEGEIDFSEENNNNVTCPSSQHIMNDSDEDSNFEPPEVLLSSQNNETNETENVLITNYSNEEKVKIKKEPIDIVQMLEELGDNYTTTVIDIQDPFLVIEISSDSSDSDDDDDVLMDVDSS